MTLEAIRTQVNVGQVCKCTGRRGLGGRMRRHPVAPLGETEDLSYSLIQHRLIEGHSGCWDTGVKVPVWLKFAFW